MSTPVRASAVHLITGQPEQIRAALELAQRENRLVDVDPPGVAADGTVTVRATLLEPVRRPSTVRRRVRQTAIVVGAAVGLGLAVALVWAVVLLVLWVIPFIAWVAAHIAVLIAAAVVIAITLYLMSGRSSDDHCPGCKKGRR